MEEIFEYNEEKEESNFDLKAEIFKYLTHWKWLVFGILLGLSVAYLYNRYTIPKYKSEASLMILSDDENGVSGVLDGGGGSAGSFLKLESNNLENQIVALKSKRLISKVIDDLDLNIFYFISGNVIETEAYKASPINLQFATPDSIVNQSSLRIKVEAEGTDNYNLYDDQDDLIGRFVFGENVAFENLNFSIDRINRNEAEFVSSKPVYVEIEPVIDVAQRYIDYTSIMPKGQAQDILSISTLNTVSSKGEDFLNNLMFQFNQDGISDKRQVALKTTEFIQNRLEIISSELDSVETGIADFKRTNELMDVSSNATEFMAKRTEAEQAIFDIETQLSIIESIKTVIDENDSYELLPGNVGVDSPEVLQSIQNYNQLVLERKALLQDGTKENPVVEDLDAQIDAVRRNLDKNIAGAINSLNLRLKELNRKEQTASSRYSTFPGMEKGMRGIVRQQQIKEQLYLFLLQRREEAAIAFAATSSVSKVIDAAFTNPFPVGPQPYLILIGGFVLGLLIPILIIFIKNQLDTKVHHKGDLNSLLKIVPFVGEVPKIAAEQSDIIQINDRSPLAESFRILRTNLAYLIQKRDRNDADVLYVTSTIKGEGKTFISFNLARTLASTNRKVLLIGADIRNPKLHRYTSLAETNVEKGLSDFLYDFNVQASDLISQTEEEGIQVDVILSGPIPPNPAELLMNKRMEELIENVRPLYDYVIVDTAPTMIVTDTLLISQLADYTLYVTRADYTEKNLLEFPKDLKKQGKLKGVAVILNDVDYSKFSYGAKYGYSYGYGYGYGVDEENRWQKLKKRLFG